MRFRYGINIVEKGGDYFLFFRGKFVDQFSTEEVAEFNAAILQDVVENPSEVELRPGEDLKIPPVVNTIFKQFAEGEIPPIGTA